MQRETNSNKNNMQIATNVEAIKFRMTRSGYITAHLKADFWLRQLSKLL